VRQVDDVPGFVARPMTRDDVERKFRMNAGERLDALKVRRVLDAFWTIDERPGLAGLLASLS
jgi:2-methylcitrate dehydratase